jgi:hypothetical protein
MKQRVTRVYLWFSCSTSFRFLGRRLQIAHKLIPPQAQTPILQMFKLSISSPKIHINNQSPDPKS